MIRGRDDGEIDYDDLRDAQAAPRRAADHLGQHRHHHDAAVDDCPGSCAILKDLALNALLHSRRRGPVRNDPAVDG